MRLGAPVSRWQSQPPYRPPINWADPLAKGLIFSAFNSAQDHGAQTYEYVRRQLSGNAAAFSTGTSPYAFATGPLGRTRVFNASLQDYAYFAMPTLPLYRQVTFTGWCYWDTFANDDKLMFEQSNTSNLLDGGCFIINMNDSSTGGKLAGAVSNGGLYSNFSVTRPSAGAWHHYAYLMDRNQNGAAANVAFYIDAVPQTMTPLTSTFTASDFSPFTLYFMCRHAGGLFGNGRLANVNLHGRLLTAQEVTRLYREPWALLQPPQRSHRAAVRNYTISGQIKLSGSPVASCPVFVYRRSDGALMGSTTTDGSGNYTFNGLTDVANGYEVIAQDATNTYNLGRLDRVSAG